MGDEHLRALARSDDPRDAARLAAERRRRETPAERFDRVLLARCAQDRRPVPVAGIDRALADRHWLELREDTERPRRIRWDFAAVHSGTFFLHLRSRFDLQPVSWDLPYVWHCDADYWRDLAARQDPDWIVVFASTRHSPAIKTPVEVAREWLKTQRTES